MPATASKSKLFPFISDLSEWRSAGKTHVEIAELLLSEKGIKVAPSTVFEFLKTLDKTPSQDAQTSPAIPAAIREQLSRIESGLEAIRAAILLAEPSEPTPACSPYPDPAAGFVQIQKALDNLARSIYATVKSADAAATTRHDELVKLVSGLPSQLERISPKSEPPRAILATVPKVHFGRIWLRAVFLTSLFWLAVWWFTKA